MIKYYNRDCVEAMKEYPDKYFDLAIVDPIYGDVTKGGYMNNSDSTTKLAKPKKYHLSIWNQEKTGKDYFEQLLRVSKNQIIWGVIILQIICLVHNVGSVGINKEPVDLVISN